MCDICMVSPCAAGCPNAPDPDTVFTCKHCGEPIVVGDDYYEMDGDHWHEDCFRDCAVEILVEIGASRRTAESSDIDDGGDAAYEEMRDMRYLYDE